MEILIGTVMVLCFLSSAWWLVAHVTGPIMARFIIKTLAVIGVAFPIFYLLSKLNVI